MKSDSSKKLIQKKDKNVIFGLFQEGQSKEERGSALRAQNEDQFYHPSFSGSESHPEPERKDLWIGISSTACLLMVLCGITFMNVKNGGLLWNDPSRSLASFDSGLDALNTQEMKREQAIIHDLHSGRRDLASIRPSSSLLKKENFEHNVLKSYHLFFSENSIELKEARLQPDQDPLFIQSVQKFIKEQRDFFPPYKNIETVKTLSEDGVSEQVYRLSGAGGDVSYFQFRLSEDQKLLSITRVENHR